MTFPLCNKIKTPRPKILTFNFLLFCNSWKEATLIGTIWSGARTPLKCQEKKNKREKEMNNTTVID